VDETTPAPTKKYYSISETSELLEVKPHVLRYWEGQFPTLKPRKSRSGNRMYQDRDIDALRSIKEMLYDRGYTIAGARERINQERRKTQTVGSAQMDFDFLSPSHRKQLRLLREELVKLRDWLARTPKGQ
jgi:DNA-binding transcriptional MerR regulator